MARRSPAWLVLATSVAFAAGFALASVDETDDEDTPDADLQPIDELPFPAQGPFGRTTTGEPVQVVDGTRVLSIIGGPSPPFTVVLEVTGDVEAVIDGYAAQLGCHPPPADALNACIRSPQHFELVGLAGGDFYSLHLGEQTGSESWVAVFTYADG